MKKPSAILITLSLLASFNANANPDLMVTEMSQLIIRSGTQPAIEGSNDYFTGNVRIDPLFGVKAELQFSAAYVTFEPGARSFWHTHPTGQHLIITSCMGRTGVWNGQAEEIKAGDVIWCPPGVKHWHGASPTTAMTHMALTSTLNNQNIGLSIPVPFFVEIIT